MKPPYNSAVEDREKKMHLEPIVNYLGIELSLHFALQSA